MHPVIGRSGFFAKSDDFILFFNWTFDQARQKMLTDHAIANDDYVCFTLIYNPDNDVCCMGYGAMPMPE